MLLMLMLHLLVMLSPHKWLWAPLLITLLSDGVRPTPHHTSGIHILRSAGISQENIDIIANQAGLNPVNPTSTIHNTGSGGNICVGAVAAGAAMTKANKGLEGNPGVVGAVLTVQAGVDEEESESDNQSDTGKKRKKLESGINAKPAQNVKSVQIWPHYNLQCAYAATPLTFNQLTFEQLIAGETKTISNSADNVEKLGRLNLLNRLSVLRNKGYPWPKLRNLYAAVVREIKMHNIMWCDDWRHIEDAVIDPSDWVISKVGDKQPDKKKDKEAREEWFCRNFNKPEGCQLSAPHEALVGRPAHWRQVKHFCAACYIQKKEINNHSEASSECPLKG